MKSDLLQRHKNQYYQEVASYKKELQVLLYKALKLLSFTSLYITQSKIKANSEQQTNKLEVELR